MATETYFTAAELKAHLRVTDALEDTLLGTFLTPASRTIDDICGRRFWKDDAGSARSFRPHHRTLCLIDDAVSISAVATDDADGGSGSTAWATTDWISEPDNGVGPNGQTGWPIQRIRAVESRWFPCVKRPAVYVTAVWGWNAVPEAVKQAALIAAAELYALGTAPLGVTGFADVGIIRVRENPIVRQLLGPYIHPLKKAPELGGMRIL